MQTALVHAYVAVTDGDWYSFLAARPYLNEVNFWRPGGGRAFQRLEHGEPFFFKTHAPHNRVVGGGFFSGFAPLPLSDAWSLFGVGNGVDNIEEMRRRIARYRRLPIGPYEDPEIGCIFVRDPVFFAPDNLAAPPPDFAGPIVQGKGYDLANPAFAGYFSDLLHRMLGAPVGVDLGAPWHRAGPVFGDPRLRPRRLGQQAFEAVVRNAYAQRCAITGAKIRPVLQAAHIRPVAVGGEHRLDNGLLLRSDVHTLYDRGYLGIDLRYRLLVSPRLRTEFGNGERFYALAGQPVALPGRRPDRPGHDFLQWHLDEVFLAA